MDPAWIAVASAVIGGLVAMATLFFKGKADAAAQRDKTVAAAREAIREDRSVAEKAMEGVVARLEAELARTDARIVRLEAALASLQEKSLDYASKLAEVQIANVGLVAELAKVQKENAELRAEIKTLREQITTLLEERKTPKAAPSV